MKHVGYKGAQEILGMPLGTLYGMVSRSEIPHIRLGRRHVLFDVEELMAWLKAHRVSPKSARSEKEERHG